MGQLTHERADLRRAWKANFTTLRSGTPGHVEAIDPAGAPLSTR